MWEAWSRPNVTRLGQGRNKIQSIKLPLKSPVISTVAPITFNPVLLTISCLGIHANVCVKRERNVLPFREFKTFLSEVTLPRVIYTLGSFSTAAFKTNFNLIVRQTLKDSHKWCGRRQNSMCLASVLAQVSCQGGCRFKPLFDNAASLIWRKQNPFYMGKIQASQNKRRASCFRRSVYLEIITGEMGPTIFHSWLMWSPVMGKTVWVLFN